FGVHGSDPPPLPPAARTSLSSVIALPRRVCAPETQDPGRCANAASPALPPAHVSITRPLPHPLANATELRDLSLRYRRRPPGRATGRPKVANVTELREPPSLP